MVKTKKTLVPKASSKLTKEEQFWQEVDQQSHYLVADTLNKILPLPNLRDKKNLDLEKDADYRTLLFEYETNYSERNNSSEVLAEQIAYEYLVLVVKSLLGQLSDFSCHLGFEELNLTD
jgi:hypothetical protein